MINLLPQYWQKKLQEEEMSKIAAILGIVAVLSLVAFILMLALVRVYYYVQFQYGQIIVEEKEQEMKMLKVAEIEEQVASSGGLATKVGEFYENQTKTTEIFAQVAAALPSGVGLSRFEYSFPKVGLEGYSPNRDLLVEFRNNLEGRPDFKKINFPPESWLTAQNIEFSVNFEYAKP